MAAFFGGNFQNNPKRLIFKSDILKMGMLKIILILISITESVIHTDVARPDYSCCTYFICLGINTTRLEIHLSKAIPG